LGGAYFADTLGKVDVKFQGKWVAFKEACQTQLRANRGKAAYYTRIVLVFGALSTSGMVTSVSGYTLMLVTSSHC
jgi:hypothetical protein